MRSWEGGEFGFGMVEDWGLGVGGDGGTYEEDEELEESVGCWGCGGG